MEYTAANCRINERRRSYPSGRIDRSLYNEKLIEIEPIETNQMNIAWEWSFWNHLG